MASRAKKQLDLIDVEDKQFEVLEVSDSIENHPLAAYLRKRVVGQDSAIRALVQMYMRWELGLVDPKRPLGAALFLGPTGVGKTQLVSAFAEYMFGAGEEPLRIDCGEFQADHDIEKLKGSPPGYLGHRETVSYFNTDRVERRVSPRGKFGNVNVNILLVDEIEKASNALFKLLLAIMDEGRFTTGLNQLVHFNKVFVFLTSNLGAEEMQNKLGSRGTVGFATSADANSTTSLHEIAVTATRKKFSPEFFNRLDLVETFSPLTRENMRAILSMEVLSFRQRLLSAGHPVGISLDAEAEEYLLREGFDQRYGARFLKRAFERLVVTPLQALLADGKRQFGETLTLRVHNNALRFTREKSVGAA